MFGKKSSVLWCMLFAAMTAACSVKEDRADCPCRLILDFNKVDGNNLDSLEISLLDADDIICLDVVRKENFGEEYGLSVPKEILALNVYSFAKGGPRCKLEENGAGLLIPPGSECPPVYMFASELDTKEETYRVEVVPKKNYCSLFIRLITEGESDFALELQGKICGYGRDGKPLDGRFDCVPRGGQAGEYEARIPRQTDNSLILAISGKDGLLRNFSLGEYIIAAGYDWTAEELEDVEVEIDYASTQVTFVVNDWEATVSFEVII